MHNNSEKIKSLMPPSPLILDGNLCENFRKFKQNLEIFMLVTGFVSKESHVKVVMLLNVICDDDVELYNTFELTQGNRKDYTKVLQAFSDYRDPVKNIVVERLKFHSTDLKTLIKSCEFKDQTDNIIFIIIRDKSFREHLLREPNLTLPKAIEQCWVAKLGRQQA
ncbi:hypothetical protein PR048_009707 [Dryococelus australis]|uniref:Uncharacterized protein n=1 Tax=Dryococelus australis TaxID=614101 RepID=A0ABQ9I1M2_9NEOP|nr:hypothetical protein PR048_009707 [Dryococelus australis]